LKGSSLGQLPTGYLPTGQLPTGTTTNQTIALALQKSVKQFFLLSNYDRVDKK